MVNIIVCVKQVPDVAELKIDPLTHNVVREGVPSIVNPDDRIGVEEALRIKEKYGGRITILSMGPPQAKAALFECLSMGTDDAILLSDRTFAAADTLATAYTLARAIKMYRNDFDLIICGRRAIDAETGQTGIQIAEQLEIPHLTYVKNVQVFPDEKKVVVRREVEGQIETIEAPIPILLTVMEGLNKPRLPNLREIIKSKKKEIRVVNATELGGDLSLYGLKGSPTWVAKVYPPPPKPGGTIKSGEPKESVSELINILAEKKLIVKRVE
ncbi:MAG: electron transfer flavoprotein subunit beta/FixA family protein [Thaumarchaeota archaeon]|nr:electron transfer flavoprotein subunit beta/FixA family protein [Nitrososphaerota archaeon]